MQPRMYSYGTAIRLALHEAGLQAAAHRVTWAGWGQVVCSGLVFESLRGFAFLERGNGMSFFCSAHQCMLF